jgi:hypothetical protein
LRGKKAAAKKPSADKSEEIVEGKKIILFLFHVSFAGETDLLKIFFFRIG